MIKINNTLSISDKEVHYKMIKSSGPGGQNVNKNSTAVTLEIDINNSRSIPIDVKNKLLNTPHSYLTKNQVAQIESVLNDSDSPEIINHYENRVANLIGSGYAISFAAGRMAFFSLLKAFNVGVGDEVILPGFTCSVMPNAVLRTGAAPVFTDICRATFGSEAKAIRNRITSRTKVIVAQHSFGIPCQVDEIAELAKKHSILLIEDCALTIDSALDGVKVGNWGDAAIFSTDLSKKFKNVSGIFFYFSHFENFSFIASC